MLKDEFTAVVAEKWPDLLDLVQCVTDEQWAKLAELLDLYHSGARAPEGWHFTFWSNLVSAGCSVDTAKLLARIAHNT